MFGERSHIVSGEDDAPLIHRPDSGNCIEHGGFASAVAADDGDKIPWVEVQGEAVQGALLIDSVGVEGLADLF